MIPEEFWSRTFYNFYFIISVFIVDLATAQRRVSSRSLSFSLDF